MERIKKLFNKLSVSAKDTFKAYPIFIIVLYCFTIFFAFGEDFVDHFDEICSVMMTTLVGICFVETVLVNLIKKVPSKIVTIIGSMIAFVIAILFQAISNYNNDYIDKVFVAYMLLEIISVIYYFIKLSELSFKEYVNKLFNNLLNVSIIYAVLNIGISILIAIFVELLLDGDSWDLIFRMLVVILGWYYVPSMIYSFRNVELEVSKFVKGLVTYVCMPIIVIAVAIIYMYLVKIIISGELLKNSLFFILAFVFTAVFPIAIMISNYRDNKVFDFIYKLLIYSYMPLILLEIYAMSIRVNAYGLTPSRVFGYEYVLVQIVCYILLFYKDSRFIDKVVLFVGLLVGIELLTPLNAQNISIQNQKNLVRKYVSKYTSITDIEGEDRKKLLGACDYLMIYDEELFVYSLISEKDVEKLMNIEKDDTNNEYYGKYDSIYCNKDLDGFDISKYKKIYSVDYTYRPKEEDDYEYYQIDNRNYNIKETVNIRKYINILINEESAGNRAEDYFKEDNIIRTTSGNYDFYITRLNFRYTKFSKVIEYVSVDGYLLEK